MNRRNAEHYLYAEQLRMESGAALAVGGVIVHELTKIARLPDLVPMSTTPPTKDGELAGMEGALGIPISESGADDNCDCEK
ncbi:hypothetical protein [Ralstonia solanacearum]|uniref:hypothetical protein n=1 Tax=Ralstonia solanacearum TaxID=305 RepID=UPI0013A60D9B|nr:hypothetical protein [Ralstonia solanacearum]